MLLLLDESEGIERHRKEVADSVGRSRNVVAIVAKRYREHGVEFAVSGKREIHRDKLGHNPTLSHDDELDAVNEYNAGGKTFKEIGERYGVSRETIRRAYGKHQHNNPDEPLPPSR